MMNGKKRYLLLGLLAIELVSLPAAAQIVNRVAFEVRPLVTAVEIPTAEPGISRFLVASNAGFSVKAKGVVGDVRVNVHVSGTMGGETRFGDAAQLPGQKTSCASASSISSDIYKAYRKTAATPGTPPEQAVVFEFSYSANARPDFEFKAGTDTASLITSCSGANS